MISINSGSKVDLMSDRDKSAMAADFTSINSSKTTDKRNIYLKNAMKSKETNPIFQRRTSSAMTKHRLPKQSKQK